MDFFRQRGVAEQIVGQNPRLFFSLFLCFPVLLTPLCLLGLLIKERYRICGECGMELP